MKLIEKIRARQLVADTRGLSTVEYVIILALIAALAVATWNTFGNRVESYLHNSSNTIDNNIGSAAGNSGGNNSGGSN